LLKELLDHLAGEKANYVNDYFIKPRLIFKKKRKQSDKKVFLKNYFPAFNCKLYIDL